MAKFSGFWNIVTQYGYVKCNMACRYREELVGKRFISVRSPQKLKIQKISEWEWRSGVVRAVSSKDTSSLDLSVSIGKDISMFNPELRSNFKV